MLDFKLAVNSRRDRFGLNVNTYVGNASKLWPGPLSLRLRVLYTFCSFYPIASISSMSYSVEPPGNALFPLAVVRGTLSRRYRITY